MNLLEITIVMLLVSMLAINTPPTYLKDPFKLNLFKSEYLHTQFFALSFHRTEEIALHWGVDLRFNGNGNVNRPYRISFEQTDLVILLGTGRFYEQRIHDD